MANKRQQIVDAIIERMESISWVKKVSEWDETNFGIDQLPVIIVQDPLVENPSDGIGNGRRDHDLAVNLTIKVAGNTSPAKARQYLADVVAAIGTDYKFNNLAYDTILNGSEMDVSDTAKLIAEIHQVLTIRYRTDLWSI